MVNGGTLPVPHVVKSVDGKAVEVPAGEQVLTPALSKDLIAIMKRVVVAVPFYSSRTKIPGYVVGGKTGTAQIWDSKKKRWRSDVYNFSFAGFVGRTAPDLVIAVRITEGKPVVNQPGNLVNPVESFELFRRIATDAMSTLDLPPVARSDKKKSADGADATTRPGATAKPRATAKPQATVEPDSAAGNDPSAGDPEAPPGATADP
jgi:membrane peptidoglycan carboxypeptidase